MAKKKSTLGKLIAFTTTVAAVGGVCYVYRDKIKESSVYKKSMDAFSNLRNKVTDKFAEEDDFFFDDDFEDDFEDDVFSEEAKTNREYTSITINPKNCEQTTPDNDAEIESEASDEKPSDEDDNTTVISDTPVEDMKEIFADTAIPTITFGTKNNTDIKEKTSDTTESVEAYENEGLSDNYEEPDVLEDQDRLDF